MPWLYIQFIFMSCSIWPDVGSNDTNKLTEKSVFIIIQHIHCKCSIDFRYTFVVYMLFIVIFSNWSFYSKITIFSHSVLMTDTEEHCFANFCKMRIKCQTKITFSPILLQFSHLSTNLKKFVSHHMCDKNCSQPLIGYFIDCKISSNQV